VGENSYVTSYYTDNFDKIILFPYQILHSALVVIFFIAKIYLGVILQETHQNFACQILPHTHQYFSLAKFCAINAVDTYLATYVN